MKLKLIILALVPLLFVGCLNDIFDKGDAERVYDGPTQLELKPLQSEFNLSAGTATVEVQLIGEQRDSDTTVNFSVDSGSTAVAGTHYTIASSSPVTIAANTSTTTITINLIADSLDPGTSVRLTLNLDENQGDVQPAENLDTANIFISQPS
jgi:hypothetical protein